jgi:hypothetical protein
MKRRLLFALAFLLATLVPAQAQAPSEADQLRMIIQALQDNLAQQERTISDLQAENATLFESARKKANSEKIQRLEEQLEASTLELQTTINVIRGQNL